MGGVPLSRCPMMFRIGFGSPGAIRKSPSAEETGTMS